MKTDFDAMTIDLDYDDGTDTVLPARAEVCPQCRGRGTIVNPAVDGNGLTAEDFGQDPEFLDDYLGGVFNIPCPECSGRRVVLVADEERLTPAQLELWEGYLSYREELAAEASMRARGIEF